MIEFLAGLHPVMQAFLATCFTWGVTALGAASVFTFKEVSGRVLDGMLGFAAGVMIAASFWSLLAPAIEMAEASGLPAWLPAAAGFLLGGLFLRVVDDMLPRIHCCISGFSGSEKAGGIKTGWHRVTLLILAITLHNIPEGLAVGVAFGALAAGYPYATLVGATTLAIGIGIQNFPEGVAVSMPLRREGMSRPRCFWYGQLSAVVEPIAAVVGAGAVILAEPLLPYALGFAAGAMIFVVVEELIPECQRGGNASLATAGAMIGFAVMMVLDVAFG